MAGKVTRQRQCVQQGQGTLKTDLPDGTNLTDEERFMEDRATLMATAVTEPGGFPVSDAPLPPIAEPLGFGSQPRSTPRPSGHSTSRPAC